MFCLNHRKKTIVKDTVLTFCDVSLINNIGNLTLFEGNNSDNGHKGNSAAGSKEYDKKISSYRESSSKTTRNLAMKYAEFNEATIKLRCVELAAMLNKHTRY